MSRVCHRCDVHAGACGRRAYPPRDQASVIHFYVFLAAYLLRRMARRLSAFAKLVCVCHALYTTIRRCAVNRHSPHSRQGSRHMRRQRSAGRDSRHCHGHGGDTHGVVLPHHNTPGPVRAATPQQRGSCIIASVRAGGTGGISTHAHPSAMARPVTSRHHGAYAISHPLARAHAISEREAWLVPHAAAADVHGCPLAHTARTHSSHEPSAQSSRGPHEAH